MTEIEAKTAERREHFIPFRKRDVLEMCLADPEMDAAEKTAFGDIFAILDAIIHFEYHRELRRLKDGYAPFDPDADTRTVRVLSPEEKAARQKSFTAALNAVLTAANYTPLSREDIDDALREQSVFKIRLEVDFDDFEEVVFYKRGESVKEETVKSAFGLVKKTISFTNYERVAIYIKFRDADYFAAKKRKSLYFTPGSTVIKLFRNVPRADLEMLFPNGEIRMRLIDKLLIGVPAVGGGIAVLVSRLSASLILLFSLFAFYLGFSEEEVVIRQSHLVALGAGLATLGGFIFKQVTKFKTRQIKFMKALSDSLYFRNLDNNAGVFHRLIDAAEEEEVKETLLGYFFLLKHPEGLTVAALDAAIEQWFAENHGERFDFEVADAMKKLARLDMVRQENGGYRARPMDEVKAVLDARWDGYFTWHQSLVPALVPAGQDAEFRHAV